MVTHLERPGNILSLSQQFKKEEALVRGGEADEPNFRKREILTTEETACKLQHGEFQACWFWKSSPIPGRPPEDAALSGCSYSL